MKKEEEYSLFFEQVNKLSERRQAVTATYLSVNAAIFAVVAFIMKDVQMIDWGKNLSVLFVLTVGVVICDLWRRLISRYSNLLRWWFEQLRHLEGNMSESSKLLTKEYEALYKNKHLGIAQYETTLISIFMSLYGIFGLMIVGSFLFF